MTRSIAIPRIFLRCTIALVFIAKKYLRQRRARRMLPHATEEHAAYDEKDTVHRKLLRRTRRFRSIITIFADPLIKANGQLMLSRAMGAESSLLAIFI
jgi:hypothetical protein